MDLGGLLAMLPGPGGQSCHQTPSGCSGFLTGTATGTGEAPAELQLWNSLCCFVCSLCWSCQPFHSLSLLWQRLEQISARLRQCSSASQSFLSLTITILFFFFSLGSPQDPPPRVTQLPSSSSSLPFPHPEQRRSVPEGPDPRKDEGAESTLPGFWLAALGHRPDTWGEQG